VQNTTSASTGATTLSSAFTARWRVVDIVVASVIGVAAGVIYWAYGLVWEGWSSALGIALPGSTAFFAGVWLFAGVLGALIIRKPGAALYTELLAATVSAIIGTQWAWWTIEAGIVQGIAAELIFAIFLYRRWGLTVTILAGAVAGLGMAVNDLLVWFRGYAVEFQIVYLIAGILGGAVFAGALTWFLARALAATGALGRFASGREATREV
jgi:energy-coupling factor transport system substrate-specific component